MLTQSLRDRLGRALELEVERGLAGHSGRDPRTLERDLKTVLERGGALCEEQVALALGIALALSLRDFSAEVGAPRPPGAQIPRESLLRSPSQRYETENFESGSPGDDESRRS